MKIVEVTWRDSVAAGGQWEDCGVAKEMTLSECRSVGFLICRDKEKVTLAQSLGRNGQAVINVVSIPKGCVLEIKELST